MGFRKVGRCATPIGDRTASHKLIASSDVVAAGPFTISTKSPASDTLALDEATKTEADADDEKANGKQGDV